MISRFIKVADGLFRGSAPSPQDVIDLYKNYGIRKIISLDAMAGEKINKVCHMLGINHITIPINGAEIKPLMKLFSYDLYDLLMNGGPTYVHCIHGKDRTGMVIALFKCKYMGVSCQDALKEAKSLGFGIGVPHDIINLYSKLVCKACAQKHQHQSDVNSADIVDNTREHADFMGSVLDSATMQSFAPFMDGSKQYPYSPQYDYTYEQYPTRNNHDLDLDYGIEGKGDNQIPQVGIFDESIKGVGPVELGGQFTQV